MSTHTPGPWTATVQESGESFSLDGPNKECIISGCGCCGSPFMNSADHAADARLIAAAPDLLEALKMFVWPYQEQCRLTEAERMQQARAAIAKATGETHEKT